MILFLANQIGGNHGNPSANLEILISLLLTQEKVGIIYFSRNPIPKTIDGKKIPRPALDFSFKKWPPFEKHIQDLVKRLKRQQIRLLISNDCAFHNLFKFRIFKLLPNLRKIERVILTQIQTKHYRFPIPKEELLKRLGEYDHFVTTSKNVIAEWRSFGLKTKHAHSIANCCNESETENLVKVNKGDLRKKLGLPQNKFISVCVATLQTRKNQKLIIDNASWFRKNFPSDLFYFIGGISDFGGQDIVDQIQSPKNEDNLKLVGEVEQAIPYIRAADLLILPSLAEVLPISILEAMALRTPVLASNVGGVSELINHKENGFYFNVSNNEEFLECYAHLRKNGRLRSRFAEISYNKYHAQFSRKRHEKLWSKLMKEICNN